MTELFKWTTELEVGNTFIDGDHKALISLINHFHLAIEKGHGKEEVEYVLTTLVNYTRDHFFREEAEMHRIGYAHILQHQLEHYELLNQVASLLVDSRSNAVVLTTKMSEVLKDWLINHIENTDKQFARAIREKYEKYRVDVSTGRGLRS